VLNADVGDIPALGPGRLLDCIVVPDESPLDATDARVVECAGPVVEGVIARSAAPEGRVAGAANDEIS
jgi:hypothetical protein